MNQHVSFKNVVYTCKRFTFIKKYHVTKNNVKIYFYTFFKEQKRYSTITIIYLITFMFLHIL